MQHTKIEIVLYFVDAAWSLCFIFPILVVYWSGTWALVDYYAEKCFHHQEVIGSCVCILIGSFILIEAYFVLPLFRGCVAVSCWSIKHIILSRICIYICALGSLLYWRGIWNITMYVFGNNMENLTVLTLIALMLLILLKSSSSPVGSPFAVALDLSQDFYQAYPRFRHQMDTVYYFTLDVLFSIYFIMTLNIVVWVGLWKLGDILILPNDGMLSLIVSLVAGYGCSIVIFALWLPLHAAIDSISANTSNLLAFGVEAIYNTASVIVVLLLWRGLWGMIQHHLAKVSNVVTIAWICHSLGFLAMITFQVGRTLGSVGCGIDGKPSFVNWPMEYFIVVYRYKKQQLERNRARIQSHSESEIEAEDPLLPSASGS